MSYNNIIVEVDGEKAIIKINRPKALNALNTETLNELRDAFTALENEKKVRLVIFTGEGKAFIAGADIGELKECDVLGGKAFAERGHQLFKQIEDSNIISIAAVNGFALGGGCEFAMAADLRIASEKAKFGQPEVSLGIIPGFGGTQRLPRLVGKGRAKELVLTGRMVNAEEALRIGLVEMVFPLDTMLEEANKVADSIISKGPIAVVYAKNLINRGLDISLDHANALEMSAFSAICGTEDKNEGLTAFLEKRKADFKNN